MQARTIRVDATMPQPWRNGGGTTRELLTGPDTDRWQWRVSVADVEQDGPFSAWPGVERWFAVLDGAGVDLVIDGVAHRVTPATAALRFDGAAITACRLVDGPTRDLNLMLRGARGSLESVVDAEAWRPAALHCGLFAASAGRCRADDAEFDMPAHSLSWFDEAPRSMTFTAEPMQGRSWWLSASPPAGER